MKKWIFCGVLFLWILPVYGLAQDSDNCFQRFVDAGKLALEQFQYDEAINQFKAAKICARNEQESALIAALLEQTNDFYITALKEEQQNTERERVKAVANQLALLATKELESDSADNALILAFAAAKLLGDQAGPAVKYAFGQAVFASYAKVVPIPESKMLYSVTPLQGYPGFICQVNSTQMVLVNCETGTSQPVGRHDGHITSFYYNPSIEKMLTTSTSGSTIRWSLEGGKEEEMKGHNDDVTFAVLSTKDGYVLSGSRDQTAILWNREGQELTTLKGHSGYLYEGHFSEDELMLTRASDGLVKVWNRSGKCLSTIDGHDGYVYSAAFWPGGRLIITTAADGTAKVWDLEGKLVFTMDHGTSAVRSALVSVDGKRVLTRSVDQSIRLWDEKGKLIRVIGRTSSPLLSSGFSPDGRLVFYSEAGGRSFLWGANWDLTLPLEDAGRLSQATVSNDQQHYLTAATDGMAKLWDQEGNLLLSFDLETPSPDSPVFSYSDDYLAATIAHRKLLICPMPRVIYRQLTEHHDFAVEKIKELERKYDISLGL